MNRIVGVAVTGCTGGQPTERHTEGQAEAQTETQTERQIEKQRPPLGQSKGVIPAAVCSPTLRRAAGKRYRHDSWRQTDRQTERQTERQAERQAERQTERQAGWQTERQAGRQRPPLP